MFNERKLDLIIMMENNVLKGPSLLLKTYPLMKYYHKDTSLESLPLLYDTSTEYKNIDTEIEQLLLKACMKEGYVILQKFMDQSPYCKYLSSSATDRTSSLYLYYHEDAHQIILNILNTIGQTGNNINTEINYYFCASRCTVRTGLVYGATFI